MNEREKLIKKLYQSLNVLICELKTARDYGTGHKLTYADISLLKCVQHYENAKAGDLSRYMGITNGAVAQFAKKLNKRGYLNPYHSEGNKKEVYYMLTSLGEEACRGYDRHYGEMKADIESYIDLLNDETVENIVGLMETVVQSTKMDHPCSVKTDQTESVKSDDKTKRRCEKCERIY